MLVFPEPRQVTSQYVYGSILTVETSNPWWGNLGAIIDEVNKKGFEFLSMTTRLDTKPRQLDCMTYILLFKDNKHNYLP